MAGGIIGGLINAALPNVLPSIADTAKILVDRLVPDPRARDEAAKQIEEAISVRVAAEIAAVQAQNDQQAAINLVEAQGNDKFSSRWRPAAAWACVAALWYQYLAAPILTWIGALIGTAGDFSFPAPPTVSMTELWPVLAGLLGLGFQRTYERTTGVPGALPPKLPANQTANQR